MNAFTISYEQYKFSFVLHNIRTLAHNNQQINCSIRRTDCPQATWTWEGMLWQGLAVQFSIVYADNVNIKGHIALYHRENNTSYIMMDALYGPGYTLRFEGIIVEIQHPDPGDPEPPAQ